MTDPSEVSSTLAFPLRAANRALGSSCPRFASKANGRSPNERFATAWAGMLAFASGRKGVDEVSRCAATARNRSTPASTKGLIRNKDIWERMWEGRGVPGVRRARALTKFLQESQTRTRGAEAD